MRLTRQCYGCKEQIRKDEMIQYFTLSGKSSYWFCKPCYEKKMEKERFQSKVCSIFGIKSPGPRIWTERKRLHDKYGYTDDAIIDCLDFLYNVNHTRVLAESLCLVTPENMERMRIWRTQRNAQASGIAAAIATAENKEYVVPVRENKKKKKEINLDDALLE